MSARIKLSPHSGLSSQVWRKLATGFGPGLLVMLADNDAGSIVTAAQSGERLGYRLLPLQFALIFLLFMVQELAARLGLATGRGLVDLMRRRFGASVAALTTATLLASCFGALVLQMSGIASVGLIFGVPPWQTTTDVVLLLAVMLCIGSARIAERLTILIGLFGIAFLVLAFHAHPNLDQIGRQMSNMPIGDREYMYLAAANLGTSVMPWTVFYQQAAMVERRLTPCHLPMARAEILAGAVICQLFSACILITAAAFVSSGAGVVASDPALETLSHLEQSFTAAWGHTTGRWAYAAALAGSSMAALVVVCLTSAWSVAEATRTTTSPNAKPFASHAFKAVLVSMLVGAAGIVCVSTSLVGLALATGVLNALLVPVVLAVTYHLARTEITGPDRLKGAYSVVVICTFGASAAAAVYSVAVGLLGAP